MVSRIKSKVFHVKASQLFDIWSLGMKNQLVRRFNETWNATTAWNDFIQFSSQTAIWLVIKWIFDGDKFNMGNVMTEIGLAIWVKLELTLRPINNIFYNILGAAVLRKNNDFIALIHLSPNWMV